jgi:urease accessory protein
VASVVAEGSISPGPPAFGLLAALRLGSAALPIGAFAYSQGLERAVEVGVVHDAASAERWIDGLVRCSLLTADVPILLRLHRAVSGGDAAEVSRLSDFLYALRATRELREEERQLGGALFRLLAQLGVSAPCAEACRARPTLPAAFAQAAVSWGVSADAAVESYAFAWIEAQVGAATRSIPLGQGAAQRVLGALLLTLAEGLPAAKQLGEDAISATAPGQALMSAAHETQYSRLFRS